MLNVPIVPCHKRYMGLPTGKDKKRIFRNLKDQIWRKINGWEGKLPSKAGKEVLIKVVCQAIPSYTISVFNILVANCGEINSTIAKFW